MFNCTCCGSEITSPYFYSGGVYGWSCIKKVNPSAKRNKPKTKCAEVHILKIEWRTKNSNLDGVGTARIEINGIKSSVSVKKVLSSCGKFYLDEFYLGNFNLFNGKWWAFVN